MSEATNVIEIGGKVFGPERTFVVGEVAMAHDGSLGTAHAFIDAIAETGADAVKFQTHIADAESTAQEPFRVKFSRQDATRYDYWKRLEFTRDQWAGLKQHAEEKGLVFLSSPFSQEAVDLLADIGMVAWKIASGETVSRAIVDAALEKSQPILVSTGMSAIAEVDSLMERIRASKLPHMVYHCASIYPTPPEKWGLNNIRLFSERYRCPVGLSDHSGTIFPSILSVWEGAVSVEVHVTLSKKAFGPDVPVSLLPETFKQMVDGIRQVEVARRHPVDKDEVAKSLFHMRTIFGKSIVSRGPIPAGTVLSKQHIAFKKPGTGISPDHAADLIGRTLKVDVQDCEFLTYAHFEEK